MSADTKGIRKKANGGYLSCVFCLVLLFRGTEGSCRNPGNDLAAEPMCCSGKNLDCKTEGYLVNREYSICYCDNYCLKTGDCCYDYSSVCQELAIDCEMSDWSPWSGCSKNCGIGVAERRRRITTEPLHGGKSCPPQREVRACYGDLCGLPEELATRGVARILPHYYSPPRKEAEGKNLIVNKIYHPEKKMKKSYCAFMKLQSVSQQCEDPNRVSWTSGLYVDTEICVECQMTAQNADGKCTGHGAPYRSSLWTALDVYGCRGAWTQVALNETCVCGSGWDFIFI